MFITAAQQRSVKLELLHNSEHKVDAAFRLPLLHKTPCCAKAYCFTKFLNNILLRFRKPYFKMTGSCTTSITRYLLRYFINR